MHMHKTLFINLALHLSLPCVCVCERESGRETASKRDEEVEKKHTYTLTNGCVTLLYPSSVLFSEFHIFLWAS